MVSEDDEVTLNEGFAAYAKPYSVGIAKQAELRYVVCCIDDTDDLEGAVSTGFIAERIAEAFVECGAKILLGITRHQLLLSDKVAYTSHNSSMCFTALVPLGALGLCWSQAIRLVEELSVDSADPGLCCAVLPLDEGSDALACTGECRLEIERLIAFGKKAKEKVCSKDEAYSIAEQISWLTLSEHGGTGLGVIGALAGVGLRLSGNDGRFRGKWNLRELYLERQESTGRSADMGICIPVGALCSCLERKVTGQVRVIEASGEQAADDVLIFLESEAKPILKDDMFTVVVEIKDDLAYPCTKASLSTIGNAVGSKRHCRKFELDTDIEERSDDGGELCANCLYRRWTETGFDCIVDVLRQSERKVDKRLHR